MVNSLSLPIEAVTQYARTHLSPARYRHTQQVAALSRKLAQRLTLNRTQAVLAAYGHDLAREWPEAQLLQYCAPPSNMDLLFSHDNAPSSATPQELAQPILLHGRAAALLLFEEFHCRDVAVLEAVRHHTQGHPQLGQIGQLLFCSDYLEPGRPHIERRELRLIKQLSLTTMLLVVLDHAAHHGYTSSSTTHSMYQAIWKQEYLNEKHPKR